MSNTTLIREANVRFGFSYLCPKDWIRFESVNSDGVRFVAPDNEKVAIYAFGQYAVATHSVDELVNFVVANESQKAGFQLLADEPVAVSVDNAAGAGPVTGRRVVFRSLNDGGLTTIQAFVQLGDVQYSLCCKAPSSEYSVYERLFSGVLQGWKILGIAE